MEVQFIGYKRNNLTVPKILERGLMIGVDARKAFDSVDHNYMQGVLEAYGFGPKCKNWFKLLSKNLKANILVNGFTTESIISLFCSLTVPPLMFLQHFLP